MAPVQGFPYIPATDLGVGGALKIDVATGMAASGLIAVTGMTASDTVMAVIKMPAPSGTVDYESMTAQVYKVEAGGFRLLVASQEGAGPGGALLVFWLDAGL